MWSAPPVLFWFFHDLELERYCVWHAEKLVFPPMQLASDVGLSETFGTHDTLFHKSFTFFERVAGEAFF